MAAHRDRFLKAKETQGKLLKHLVKILIKSGGTEATELYKQALYENYIKPWYDEPVEAAKSEDE